jgi:hypothetical protein
VEGDELLGYVSLVETDTKDGYLGAILVMDCYGVPKEFRATFPVKPTLVQKTLYGDALETYIGVELCGKPLIQSASHNINLLAVNRDSLLGIREATEFPVLFFQRTGETLEISSALESQETGSQLQIKSKSGRFQPITVSAFHSSPGDVQTSFPLMDETFSAIDLFEPFERIERALQVLASQDQRFQ